MEFLPDSSSHVENNYWTQSSHPSSSASSVNSQLRHPVSDYMHSLFPEVVSSAAVTPPAAQSETNQFSSDQVTERKSQCMFCDKRFSRVCDLRKHMIRHSEENSKDTFQCSMCGKSFSRERNLEWHMKHHSRARFACEHESCGQSFITEGGLRYHQNKFHNADL
jgi:hypothetical protein